MNFLNLILTRRVITIIIKKEWVWDRGLQKGTDAKKATTYSKTKDLGTNWIIQLSK